MSTRVAAASDKVYQLLTHGRWFSPGTPASSTTKTGRHNIAERGFKHNKSNQIKSMSTHVTECPYQTRIIFKKKRCTTKHKYYILLRTVFH